MVGFGVAIEIDIGFGFVIVISLDIGLAITGIEIVLEIDSYSVADLYSLYFKKHSSPQPTGERPQMATEPICHITYTSFTTRRSIPTPCDNRMAQDKHTEQEEENPNAHSPTTRTMRSPFHTDSIVNDVPTPWARGVNSSISVMDERLPGRNTLARSLFNNK